MATVVNDRDVLIMATVPRYTVPSNRGMFITPSTAIFKLSASGAATPASYTFQVTLLNMSGEVEWSWTDGMEPTVNGNEVTLDEADFSAVSGTITATITVDGEVYTQIATVSKVADGADGEDGLQGARGNVDISVQTTGSVWSDAEAAAGLAAAGYGAPQVRDLVNLYKADRTFGIQKMYNGSAWVTVDYVYNGNVFVKGSILPESIDTRGLSIKDPAGNIILAAGNALAEDYAPAGTLNSEVTLPSLGQNAFRVVAMGNMAGANVPASPGLYINGSSYVGAQRSYNLIAIRRTDLAIVESRYYDVFGVGEVGGATSADLAYDLNYYADRPGQFVLVVWTHDEPQSHRMDSGLPDAIYRNGGSPAIFGSSQFAYRSAYGLVALSGCGTSNGKEFYQGSGDNDPNAWIDFSFTMINGELAGVSGGYTPKSLQDYGFIGAMNANYVTDTNQLADSAGLGQSATGVSLSTTGQLIGPAGGGQVQTLPVVDNRAVDYAPQDYGVVHVKEFKQQLTIGIPGSVGGYCVLETMKGWINSSGGNAFQWAYIDSGTVWKRSAPADATSWGAWVRDLDRSIFTGDLDATAGATFGVNIGGQMTPANISTYIAAAAIHLGLIDTASIGSLSALSAFIGFLTNRVNGTGAGFERMNAADKVYDPNNVKRIQIGDLNA